MDRGLDIRYRVVQDGRVQHGNLERCGHRRRTSVCRRIVATVGVNGAPGPARGNRYSLAPSPRHSTRARRRGRCTRGMVAPPGADPTHILLFFHDGGYCSGSIASHRNLAAEAGRAAGTRTLSVQYRRAPEHPFPAATEDALRVWHWLQGQHFSPEQIVVGGDSAGFGTDRSVWFVDTAANRIGSYQPGGGKADDRAGDAWRFFGKPPQVDGPFDIKPSADDSDGTLWFTNKTGNTIGRIVIDAGEASHGS